MSGFTYPSNIPAVVEILPDLEPTLLNVLSAIANSVADIAVLLRTTGDADTKVGTENLFGDEQLHLDVATDKVIMDHLKACGNVVTASSEENPVEIDVNGGGDEETAFSVAFDPLDGSSIIDANFSVGSIYGIWPGKGFLNKTGRDQVASVISVYGPRTTLVIAIASYNKCMQLTLSDNNVWVMTKSDVSINPDGKVFAPGNLRAQVDHGKYKNLVNKWLSEKYTLRYTGGMVPDVYHILIKGKGILTNVTSPTSKAKLRLLYEVAPIALIVECSNGSSCVEPLTSNKPMSLLDVPITELDVRLGCCYGSSNEVKSFIEYMF